MQTFRLPSLLFCLVLLIAGCKKNDDVPALKYTIRLLGGDGQTDTIGRVLKNGLSFLVLRDNQPIREAYVRFETMTCDNTPQYIDFPVRNDPGTLPANPVYYQWQLNQTIGVQTLKAILLDSIKNPKDSFTVTATGIAPSAGWHISGCIPINCFCVDFAQLPSGRIFTALHQQDYPYFSDDNGATWHAVTSFPVKKEIGTVITTKEDEVFITIPNIGIYYSPDKGKSWEQRNAGFPLNYYSGDLQCTATGKLLALTITGPYYSTDKGLNWQPDNQGLLNSDGPSFAASSFAASMSDGTIIATFSGYLAKSRNDGASWSTINTGGYFASALLVDSKNYIYIGTGYNTSDHPAGIYMSKDTGQTWTSVYDPSSLPDYDKSIYQMTEKNGLYYFYSTGNNFLTQTSDFVKYTFVNPPVPIPGNNGGRVSYRYIVTNDNHFILSTEQYGLFYQTP